MAELIIPCKTLNITRQANELIPAVPIVNEQIAVTTAANIHFLFPFYVICPAKRPDIENGKV